MEVFFHGTLLCLHGKVNMLGNFISTMAMDDCLGLGWLVGLWRLLWKTNYMSVSCGWGQGAK